MGRPHRSDSDEGWFHVMNRGVNREPVFFADTDRVDFGRMLGVCWERFGIEVHAYCLMSNHFHLLLHSPAGGLSSYMHDLQSAFTRHVNDRTSRDGPLFRGRFRSLRVDSDAYLRCAARYIHRNPLDIPLVESVDGYRWSSHRTYLGHRSRPGWLRTDAILGMFGGDVNAFDRFVRGDDPALDLVDPEQIMSMIQLMVDEHWAGSTELDRGVTRAVTLLVLDRLPEQLRWQLDAALGFPSPGARRTAMSRARRLANNDPAVALIIERIERSLTRPLHQVPGT